MKKLNKMTLIVRVIGAALDVHYRGKMEEKYRKDICFREYNWNSCDDETESEKLMSEVMFSAYDFDHRHLVSNWTSNMFSGTDNYYFESSSAIEQIMYSEDINLRHLLWDQEELLPHIRYIRLGERSIVEHDNYIIHKEVGYEYDIFKQTAEPYEKAWLAWSKKGGFK